MISIRQCLPAAVIATFFLVTAISAQPSGVITDNVQTDFATYKPVTVNVVPSVNPYTISSDLSEVSNISDFDLSGGAKALLATNGFAAQASRFPQVYDVYNECEQDGIPAFVTTDACLHTYHILYDYMLKILELQYFIDDLDKLTQTMIDDSQEVIDSAQEESVKQAAIDNQSYLSVALGLLHPEMSSIPSISAQEIALVYEGSGGYVQSPLFFREDYPYMEDYSQYKPRGHYTRSAAFEQYFRAMMWYGRITFSLDLPYATQEGLRHAARQALLICRALKTADVGNEPAATVWGRIYEPTVFFVGKMDDVTADSYIGLAKEIYGSDFLTQAPDVLADDSTIDTFISRAREEFPDPKITVKAGKGYRFMGQRYIPDSYVLDQLVEENVGNRLMPRGLDVMAVLGSDRAYEILDTVYEDTQYPNYQEQMAKLRREFSEYPMETWAQNLYYNWLYSLLPLLDVKGEGYPPFMQSPAWVDKDLNSALGSWAELRHDTILYAKQSETFETAEPEPPPFIMGYVEPNPEVYARLAALAGFMREGLENRGLLDVLIADRLERFESLMLTLMTISVRELTNITPSADEFLTIANFGGTIEDIVTFPPEFSSQYESEADKFMAVIADVHTDPNNNEALEVGVGHPLNLYVIAPVDGVPTLTKGGIFSYHEFIQPLGDGRLTDEEWQALQSGPDAKDMPVWTASFMDGPSSLMKETFPFYGYEGQITSVEDTPVPQPVSLLQNSPNPFNPSTLITFTLKQSGTVKLAVYNLSGQEIDLLVDSFMPAGNHSIVWKPQGIASGIYFIKLMTGSQVVTIRAMYLK